MISSDSSKVAYLKPSTQKGLTQTFEEPATVLSLVPATHSASCARGSEYANRPAPVLTAEDIADLEDIMVFRHHLGG